MKSYNKIVFIGEGGVLRSAMAQAIMQEYRLKRPLEIQCRGMVVLFPEPINQKAEAVLISNGITVENHMSKQLTEEDFSEDTLMIVMEYAHRERVLMDYPNANLENVQVLTEITGDELEIMDPYGCSLKAYGLCYETLNKSIKKLVEIINNEVE